MNKNEKKKVEANELNEENLNEVSGGYALGGIPIDENFRKKHPEYFVSGKPGPGGILWKNFRDQKGK